MFLRDTTSNVDSSSVTVVEDVNVNLPHISTSNSIESCVPTDNAIQFYDFDAESLPQQNDDVNHDQVIINALMKSCQGN